MPKAPDGEQIYTFFKPEGSKTIHAKIKIGYGEKTHTEDFDTGVRDAHRAMFVANGRVRRLYKETGIETPIAYKRRTGSPATVWQIRRWMAGGTLAEKEAEYIRKRGLKGPRPVGRPPGKVGRPPKIVESDDREEATEPQGNGASQGDWGQNQVRIENKFAQAFQRIVGVCIFNIGDDDATVFREHVRAIVVETTLAGVTPTGRLKRKF